MNKLINIVIALLLFTILSSAEENTSNKEELKVQKSAKYISLDQIDLLEITGLDVAKAINEDLYNKTKNPDKSRYRIGLAKEVAVNTGSPLGTVVKQTTGTVRGTWEKIEGDRYLWRLRVKSVDAFALSFGFTSYHLPAGATLHIRSIDGNLTVGPYSEKDNKRSGQLWTPSIATEEAVLELNIGAEVLSDLNLTLGSVTHIYKNLTNADKSGSCNVDVACSNESSGWENQIRSVGQYSFTDSGSSYVCTGSLINNTNNDGTPYFLTANHCISDNTVAATIVVTWDYESPDCRPVDSAESGTALPLNGVSQSGATLTATHAASDFTLLLLDNDPEPSTNAFWSGWSRSTLNPNSSVSIHHPAGHAKRISHENDVLTKTSYLQTIFGDGSHFRVADWDSGTTEGGSSGAGIWDADGKIVGQLHGGYAACGNDLSDWYGRLATSWIGGGTSDTRLSDWLDPTSVGTIAQDGYEGAGTTIRTGFNSNTLLANDDGSTGIIPIGFEVDFFGELFQSLYVNNNGNITFDAVQSTYTPYDLTSTTRQIIAPFFADVDTRNSADVTYGEGFVDGHLAFGVNWLNVGYYSSRDYPLNSFQLILIDRSDIAPGDFDIEFNYSNIGWETGEASGGVDGFGGNSARVGFSNGTGDVGTYYELPGSAINGAFINGGPYALISRKYNSNILGRYVFEARNGNIQARHIIAPWLLLFM